MEQVESAFKELASAAGKRSTEKKIQVLKRLFSSMSDPLEAKYLTRILTGEMRIGLVEGLVEESIAKCFGKTLAEVRNANLVSGNVAEVAVLAKYGRLNEARITPSKPTNFMLAESAENARVLFERFEKKSVYSEYKYDGIRAQVHLKDGRVYVFSRNLENITKFFPEIERSIAKLGGELILDGEIVPTKDGTPLSFQLLQKRLRKLQRSEEDVPVRYFAFDLLYLNGSMINFPLEERIKALDSISFPDHAVLISKKRLVNTSDDIQREFERSKQLGFEGLVVKDPRSRYTPGKRGASWIKLKKELDTLNVVIVAAEYGHGKRAGVISDYTFAVKDSPSGADDEDGSSLKVIGKAYSGLTDVEIQEMTRRLKEITLKDEGYRRFVKPEIVLEVAFDAIQRSDRHGSGYALRFPRIKRIRTDKSVRDIDTLSRVEEIYKSQLLH